MTQPTDAIRQSHWSLYVVRCDDGSLYTGISPDVTRRLSQHAAGQGARYLRGRAPLTLAGEVLVGDRALASRAEYRFKRLSRAEKLRFLGDPAGLSAFVQGLNAGKVA